MHEVSEKMRASRAQFLAGEAMIPVLKSERLILRGFTWADFPSYAEMWADASLAPLIPFAPLQASDAWAQFNLNVYAWACTGMGSFAVVDHGGVFLGTILFFRNPNAGYSEEYDRSIQAGWVFANAARGRGIASEAVEMGHCWLDSQPFGGVTVCGMDPGHGASIRVAEKAGYKLMGQDSDEWGAVQMMKRVV